LSLVVLESNLLAPGQVVVVDAEGLTVGRDRSWERRLRLAELPVSKYHCQIYHSDDGYHVIDLGSRNGTFLNQQRLSDPKSSSVPSQLRNMDQLQIGSTLFEVHLHDDGWQCEKCHVNDDNTVDMSNGIRKQKPVEQEQASVNDFKSSGQREREWMEELRRLKRSFAPTEDADPNYVDAADRRRRLQATISSPSYTKTPVSPSTPAQQPRIERTERATIETPVQGVGNAMLRKMGWQEGQSLGRKGTQGILTPISPHTQTHRAGLG
ncbi:SMAD/FHA domain-containing protein, partial [Fennellomyces sp. T-0311]